eukprot:7147037-Prymnesium_polylepis.1
MLPTYRPAACAIATREAPSANAAPPPLRSASTCGQHLRARSPRLFVEHGYAGQEGECVALAGHELLAKPPVD